MTKTKFNSGDVFRISLPKGLGFAYAKYIDVLKVNPNYRYPNLLRIYNYRSMDGNTNIKLEALEESGLLFSPLCVAGIPEAVRIGQWKIIANLSVKPDDVIIPHYKTYDPFVLLDERKATDWYYVADLDKFNNKVKSTYDNVKHLETLQATGSELIGTKIAMGLLKEEGKEIKDYFALEEFYEKVYYHDVATIPAYYKQPKELQGKVMIA